MVESAQRRKLQPPAACRRKGCLSTAQETNAGLPPLIIEKSDVDEALRILCGVLSELQ